MRDAGGSRNQFLDYLAAGLAQLLEAAFVEEGQLAVIQPKEMGVCGVIFRGVTGLSFLELGQKFHKARFKVTFEAKAAVPGGTKVPDLRIIDKKTGETIYVEVSDLIQSCAEKDSCNTFRTITNSLSTQSPRVRYCGQLHKTLSKPHLNELMQRIIETVQRARKKNTLEELVIEDVIELAVVREEKEHLLQPWASKRGYKPNQFSASSPDPNEIVRTRRAIEREQRQLPKDAPGALIIRNARLFFNHRDVKKTINELEEEVYEYPHLICVTIHGQAFNNEPRVIKKDQHVFISKQKLVPFYHEGWLILHNRFAKFQTSTDTLKRLQDALRP
ncbi:hypothetical protein MYX78_00755 [Acidobacteria bacterium AH-259-G07]|nr:hypothetical protein [Acidobacteria bacterium AH-259-G07]